MHIFYRFGKTLSRGFAPHQLVNPCYLHWYNSSTVPPLENAHTSRAHVTEIRVRCTKRRPGVHNAAQNGGANARTGTKQRARGHLAGMRTPQQFCVVCQVLGTAGGDHKSIIAEMRIWIVRCFWSLTGGSVREFLPYGNTHHTIAPAVGVSI